MRVGVLGNFSSVYGTESQLAWTLSERMGIDTLRIDENSEDIIKQASTCTLIILVGSHGKSLDFSELRKKGIKSCTFHLDVWRGVPDREAVAGNTWHFSTNHFFSTDGSCPAWWEKLGAKHTYIKAGICSAYCHPGISRPEYQSDVLFVGSKNYHNEYPFRTRLIDWLTAVYPGFLHVGGEAKIHGHELNDVIASTKICVLDWYDSGRPYYSSDRLYEMLGRSAFCLMPKTEGIDYPDELCFQPQDLFSLQRLIDHWLDPKQADKRRHYSQYFMERTIKYDTYESRMRRVLREMNCV